MFSLKRHFVTEHENVLSVRYVNPTKDIKSSYFRKVTAVLNWCNVLCVVDGGRCHNEIVFFLDREKGLSGNLKIRTKII